MENIVAIANTVPVGVAGRHAIAAVVEDAAHQDGGGGAQLSRPGVLCEQGVDSTCISLATMMIPDETPCCVRAQQSASGASIPARQLQRLERLCKIRFVDVRCSSLNIKYRKECKNNPRAEALKRLQMVKRVSPGGLRTA
jgi:hypothetical protein